MYFNKCYFQLLERETQFILSKIPLSTSNSTRKAHLRMEMPASPHTRSLGKGPEKPPQRPFLPPISSIFAQWIGISAGKPPIQMCIYISIWIEKKMGGEKVRP